MSSVYNYITSWWIPVDIKTPTAPPLSETKVYLVSVNELLGVKLKSTKDVIPSPARNMPNISKFQLNMLNQANLKEILNVKLRQTVVKEKPSVYAPRHPVLKELLLLRPIIF
jgi:hypothetical protein